MPFLAALVVYCTLQAACLDSIEYRQWVASPVVLNRKVSIAR